MKAKIYLSILLSLAVTVTFTSPSFAYMDSVHKPPIEYIGTSGWYYPTGTSSLGAYRQFNAEVRDKTDHFYGKYHLGIDIAGTWGVTPVYSIGNGVIIDAGEHSDYKYIKSTGQVLFGGAMVVEYKSSNGTIFRAVYGHIQDYLRTGTTVYAGQKIATIGRWDDAEHVHFAIKTSAFDGNNFLGYSSVNGGSYGFVDPIKFLKENPADPEFFGAGSLISPNQYGAGKNYDTDAVHTTGKNGLILFQWRKTKKCDHIDISLDDFSHDDSVEIRTGPWNNRSSDLIYKTKLGSTLLPVSVTSDSEGWNVTAIKINPNSVAPQQFGRVTARCSTSQPVVNVSSYGVYGRGWSEPKGILLSNGWYWQGNGSIIGDAYDQEVAPFGSQRDTVKLTSGDGAAFFQWKKTAGTCQKLGIAATYSGNYKLRIRSWYESPNSTSIKKWDDVYINGTPEEQHSNDGVYKMIDNNYLSSLQDDDDYYLLSVYSDQSIRIGSVAPVNTIDVKCFP